MTKQSRVRSCSVATGTVRTVVSETARIEPRTSAVLRARLRDANGEREVTVIDASSRGMLAMVTDPPARGDYVELVIGPHSLVGQVRWRVGKRFGLAFQERISVAALLEGGAGSIRLSGQTSAQRRGAGLLAALTVDSGATARTMQFAVVLGIVGLGAWGVAHYVQGSLASVGAARQAMGGSPVNSGPSPH